MQEEQRAEERASRKEERFAKREGPGKVGPITENLDPMEEGPAIANTLEKPPPEGRKVPIDLGVEGEGAVDVGMEAADEFFVDVGRGAADEFSSASITIDGAGQIRHLIEEINSLYGKEKVDALLDSKGIPFNIKTTKGMRDFLAAFEQQGTWAEWDEAGVALAHGLGGDVVDKIAGYIAAGGRVNTAIMSALHHTHLLLSGQLPALTQPDKDIVRANQRIPGRAEFVKALNKKMKSEAGRMLAEARRQSEIDEAIDNFEAMVELGNLPFTLDSPAYYEFREKLRKAKEPLRALKEYLREHNPVQHTTDILMSLFYNSLLSNPGTHAVNTFDNILWGTYLAPHRAVVGIMDKIWSGITGRPRTTYATEGLLMLRGYLNGLKDGSATAAMKKAWNRTGMMESLTKTEEEMGLVDPWTGALRQDALRKFLEGKGSVGNILGRVLTAPSRGLIAMDAWAKAIAERGQEEALRYRFSQLSGEELIAAKVQFIQGSLSSLRLTDYILKQYNMKDSRNVKSIISDELEVRARLDRLFEVAVKNEMARFAEHATFQDAPGVITKGLLHLRARTGPIGRILVPFMQTILNLTKRGLELTPGVGIGLAIHEKASVPETMARQLEGLILTAILYSLLDRGAITGPPPEDPGEREVFYSSGKQPWSIKMGNQYWSYRRLEPFALPTSILAEQFHTWKTAPDDQGAMDAFLNSFIVVRDHIVDNTFMRTLNATLGEKWAVKNQLWWTTASFVPYSGFWRGMNRQFEDWTTGEVAIKDTTFMSVFGDSLPLNFLQYVETQAKLSATGEPIARKNAGLRALPREWLPIRITNYEPDAVEQLFMDIGYYPRYPGQSIKLRTGGEYVKIPEDLYRDYIIATGQRGKRALEQLASKPYFNSLPTDRKKSLVIKTWEKVRDKERENVKRILRSSKRPVPATTPPESPQ